MEQIVNKNSKMPFWSFFDFAEPWPGPITTKTSTDLEHAICVNRQVNFCKDFSYCLRRVKYAKIDQYLFMSSSVEGAGLTLSQIDMHDWMFVC